MTVDKRQAMVMNLLAKWARYDHYKNRVYAYLHSAIMFVLKFSCYFAKPDFIIYFFAVSIFAIARCASRIHTNACAAHVIY